MLTHLPFWLGLALYSYAPPPAIPSVCQPLPGSPTHLFSPSSGPPCLSGIINDYTPVLGFGCDSSSLQVGTLAGFAVGDKVLLLQMQVAQVDLSNTAAFGQLLTTSCIGNYEFNRIQSLGGSNIQLEFALTRPYDVSGKVQLVRVPEYDSATVCDLRCLAWNGSVGGVLVLDVKTQLTLAGNIDVSGQGFRGGSVEPDLVPWVFSEMQYFYPPQSTLAAAKGEGIGLLPTDHSYGRGRAGNGGGGGNAHNGGGGGGGNAGAGGDGGFEILNLPGTATPNTNGIGGQPYLDDHLYKALLGGGGGAGHANDTLGSAGGAGGGMVLILAHTLQVNNYRILANGVDVPGGVNRNDGQGGGGGGGTIVLQIAQINGTLHCELQGGTGGSNQYSPDFQLHGPGGGGGGGKLLLTQNSPHVVPALLGGNNGLTSQNLLHGAQPGAAGTLLSGFVLPEGKQPHHPVSRQLLLAVQSPWCGDPATGQISVLQSTALAFRIDNGPWQPDSIFTGLAPGTYTIGLQFSGGCSLDTVAVLTAAPPVLDSLILLHGASCHAGGALTVAAVSGTAPFEFQLDGGAWQTSGSFVGLAPGSYPVNLRDAAGCTHTSTYTIAPYLPLQLLLDSLENDHCRQGAGLLAARATGGLGNYTYQLDPSRPAPAGGRFMELAEGVYAVIVTDSAGCKARLEDLEIVNVGDTALTHETATIYEGAFFRLPDGRDIDRPGRYAFPFLTMYGCDSLHLIDLIVLPRNIYVPNVFSPNEDGENDFFTVFSDKTLALVGRLRVFDRWGELIFEKLDLPPNLPENGWNGDFRGRPVNAGVFVWFAELDFQDGVKRTIRGDVTVMR